MTVAEVQHSVITDEIQLAYLITYLQIYHDNNLRFWPEIGFERKDHLIHICLTFFVSENFMLLTLYLKCL